MRPPGRRHADLLTLTAAAATFAKALFPLVLLALVAAMAPQPSLSEPWVLAAVALAGATLLAAVAHLWIAARVQRLRREETVEIGQPAALMVQLVLVARIELVLLALLVLDVGFGRL